MKTKWSLASLLGIVLLLSLPAGVWAEGTCPGPAGATEIIADGRIVQSTIPAGQTFAYFVGGRPGNSYVLEVRNDGLNAGDASFGIGNLLVIPANQNVCTSTVTVPTRDITPLDPVAFVPNTRRRSFTMPSGDTFVRVRLVSDGVPRAYTFSAWDTTMFSPGWSTMGGTQTFWSFLNTTNATINGTLTLLDTLGTQVAALGVGILPNRAVFPSTITMAIAAGQAGTARFIHDGPPGAIQAEAAITNFTTFFQRVSFAPRVR